jgi:ribosomal protein S27AE
VTTDDQLQFDNAEATGAGTTTCAACGGTLMGSYYEANGRVVCGSCRQRLLAAWDRGSPPMRILKALLLGVGGGIMGAGLYYAVLAITGYEFSLLAIVVGFLVGKGVQRGSERRGGLGYQLLATAITYAAIVSTYVPLVFPEARIQLQAYADSMAPETERRIDSVVAAARARGDSVPPDTAAGRRFQEGSVVAVAFVTSVVLAVALPFTGGLNLIGLLIIGIGLFEAWQLNRKGELKISGPYKIGTA